MSKYVQVCGRVWKGKEGRGWGEKFSVTLCSVLQ